MKIQITFKEDITFLSIPRETFKEGETMTGEVITLINRGSDMIFLSDEAEREYQIPLSAVQITELEDK